MAQSALLLVDVQIDFCPGGALAVPDGDAVIPALNDYIARFASWNLPILASRDWHPAETSHFKAGGGPWPAHCVQDTPGAAFNPELALPEHATIVTKGTSPTDDGYSAFEATDEEGRAVGERLRQVGVRTLYVGGLATEYCVRASVLDALAQGLDTVLLLDAVRGIDVKQGDVARAIDEMIRAGARTATLATIEQDMDGARR